MTPWRHETRLFLFVFLWTIDLSKGGCKDYFSLNENWTNSLSDTIALVNTKDVKDRMECSVERECLRGRDLRHVLVDCFYRNDSNRNTTSERCEGETFTELHVYHFKCLTAKAINYSAPGCEYDTVLKLYTEITSSASNQTTRPPPPTTTTTTTTTTTLPETTTALPSTTTTTTATLPETATTTAATTTALTPTATPTTTTTTTVPQSPVSGSTDQLSGNKDTADTLKTLLTLSLSLNVIVPLAVYLFMRRRRRQDSGQPCITYVLNEDSPGAQDVMGSERASADVDLGEISHLIQPLTHVTCSPDETSKDCAAGNETLH